ncbi:hypothetical protein [Glycomyces tritici]|uniref:Uncharacterized protein n=1 Tax=Glycomyces tritici TaxID=2665176 RepID=A0ABT7YXF9_9ACTN|nr:hypothetical protein [Glycomyces tritici]MDN3241312.1 hypothetical protein [Glycomyces tritici]MDN3243335.1 hypothetical protein [Glycomyces tritici]
MRRTLKLLLLLGIGLLMAKDKDGGITPGGTDNTIDPATGKPKSDAERKEDMSYKGQDAGKDFEGVAKAAEDEAQSGRSDSTEGSPTDSDADTSQDSDGDGQPDTTSEGGPYATEENLEGEVDTPINNPNDPSDTITDIDRVKDGVLWEEKSATSAGDTGKWVDKHIEKKFNAYLRAQQYMKGYEDAPIGFKFTEPNADPAFKSAVEAKIAELQAQNPDVDIRLEWS